MSVEVFRDIVISVSGLVLIGVLVYIAVLINSLYRRIKAILKPKKVSSLQRISCSLDEDAITSIVQAATVVQGVYKGIGAISKIFKKKEGKGNER